MGQQSEPCISNTNIETVQQGEAAPPVPMSAAVRRSQAALPPTQTTPARTVAAETQSQAGAVPEVAAAPAATLAITAKVPAAAPPAQPAAVSEALPADQRALLRAWVSGLMLPRPPEDPAAALEQLWAKWQAEVVAHGAPQGFPAGGARHHCQHCEDAAKRTCTAPPAMRLSSSAFMCTGAIQQVHAAVRASGADLNTKLNNLLKMEHEEPYYRGDAEDAKRRLSRWRGYEADWRARCESKIADMDAYLDSLPADRIPPEVIDLLEGD